MAAKSSVDRYEQILAQDPTSTVFVELAKALLDEGRHQRAAEVCEAGLRHHPRSVPGRLLLGRSLIEGGSAAEGMVQLDAALELDPKNLSLHHQISELLLRKGRYKSALSVLKRTQALQPDDVRVRQQLAEAERALSGDDLAERTDVTQTAGLDLLALMQPGRPPNEAELPRVMLSPSMVVETLERDEPTKAAPAGLEPGPGSEEHSDVSLNPVPTHPSTTESGMRFVPLLEDIPDPEATETSAPGEESAPQVSSQQLKRISRIYEEELREERSQANAQRSTFLSRHGVKLAVLTVLLASAGAGVFAFITTRAKTKGRDIPTTLSLARKALSVDTAPAYREAADGLAQALELDSNLPEAWALLAYVRAVLFSDYGDTSQKASAEEALHHPGVSEQFPGLALASQYYLAPKGAPRSELEALVVQAKLDQPEVHEIAGTVLLRRKQPIPALERFKKALELSPGQVRSLVALGEYYRDNGDFAMAMTFFGGDTAKLSPEHARRVLGSAEVRIAQQQDLGEALAEMQKLPAEIPVAVRTRRELLLAELLSLRGKADEAVARLGDAVKKYPNDAFELQLGLAQALRAAGRPIAAKRAAEAALAVKGLSAADLEEGREVLGRILLATDGERELLRTIPAAAGPSPDAGRKSALVRGLAWLKLKDWAKAREELTRTQVGGKYPAEAVVAMALADARAGEGEVEKSQEILEKALRATKKAKPFVRLALGTLYWQQGATEKAQAQFEEASKDPMDYEGSCSLGRLLLQTGKRNEGAEALLKSVQRNGVHDESRHALVRAMLDAGGVEGAVEQVKAWNAAEEGSSELAHRDAALVYLEAGQAKEAGQEVDRALRLNDAVPESHRLRARVDFMLGDGRAAFASLQKANKLAPTDPETFCEVGYAFARQGDVPKAAKAYQAALRNDPNSACGAAGQAWIRLPAGAKGMAKELSELLPKARGAWERGWILAAQSRAQVAAGSVAEGRASATSAVQEAPALGPAQLALGLVASKQRDDGVAREALTRAVTLDPLSGAARLAVADLLFRLSMAAPAGPPSADLSRAAEQYQAFLRIGGSAAEEARVKRLLPQLKKRLAAR